MIVNGIGRMYMNKTINIKAFEYEIKILDSTHFTYWINGLSDRWAIPLHITQVTDDMKQALNNSGLINDRGSFIWH